VDEAGMLDQDTARALLTLADQHHVRIALLGDRHQLSAVGRGAYWSLDGPWASPDTALTIDTVHRFTRHTTHHRTVTVTVPDGEYAELSLTMRTGEQPGEVFDTLTARGQITVHPSEAARTAALAQIAVAEFAATRWMAIVADTREQAADLNAAIRDELIAAGRVDDQHTTTTAAGQRIGAGDRITTRRNHRGLDVANRDTWTITGSTGTAASPPPAPTGRGPCRATTCAGTSSSPMPPPFMPCKATPQTLVTSSSANTRAPRRLTSA
jgi:ATP-dependent exoDNAse (exonuclease V) alpha subunit